MATKKYNPITPSLRTRITNSYAEITTNVPEKSLLAPNRRSGGRNQKGEMTMRYIGGGHKNNIVLLILKETNSIFQQLLKQLNTIQTVQLSLH